MKSFIIPTFLWIYVLSFLVGERFWKAVDDRLIAAIDISPAQRFGLAIALNLVVASLGLPQVASFVKSLRRRDQISASRHVASSMCIAAVCLCVAGSVLGIVRMREQIATAMQELTGVSEDDVFAEGKIESGVYSNRIFGITIRFPDGWYPMTLNAIRRAKFAMAVEMADRDMAKAAKLTTSQPGTYALATVRRYPDTYVGYNPSLAITAFEKQVRAQRGINSLAEYATAYAAAPQGWGVRSGPSIEPVGKETGYYIHFESRGPHGHRPATRVFRRDRCALSPARRD